MSAWPTAVLATGQALLLAGCTTVLVTVRQPFERSLKGVASRPLPGGGRASQRLRAAICTAASLLVTTALVGLTLRLLAESGGPPIAAQACGVSAGMVAWYSADRIGAMRGPAEALAGGLLVALCWFTALLDVVLVLAAR
jgi:hypothetical protein